MAFNQAVFLQGSVFSAHFTERDVVLSQCNSRMCYKEREDRKILNVAFEKYMAYGNMLIDINRLQSQYYMLYLDKDLLLLVEERIKVFAMADNKS